MGPEDPPELLSCKECDNFAVGTGQITCCERPMTPFEPVAAVSEPELEDLLCGVFGMSTTELDICLSVMESGTTTVNELSGRIDRDRSVVARHLNHLAALGVVEKQRRLIEAGGHVYVYRSVEPELVRQRLTAAFGTWIRAATEQLAALRRKKVDSIVDADDETPLRLFRDDG